MTWLRLLASIVNFTERRVLQVARWLMKQPTNFPFKVDPAQFCVFGGSMGGTGAHYIGTRNGDIFAAAFADEGIFNWAPPKPRNNVDSAYGKDAQDRALLTQRPE